MNEICDIADSQNTDVVIVAVIYSTPSILQ
jgi:hypothetical protein